MNKLCTAGLASICLAIAGCVTPIVAPTVAQQQAANYGDTPTGYTASVHRYFDATLKDPSSLQYRELTTPTKGYMQKKIGLGGTTTNYGWLVKATINAKNTYGGYVGFQTYSFLFRGEQIIDTIVPEIATP